MRRFGLALVGFFFVCTGLSQNPPPGQPPGQPPGAPPTRPTLPSGPSMEREKARVIGRVFPARGENRLPDLITVSISSVRGGYFKMGLVQGSSFEFKDLLPGRYRIKVESPGYREAGQEVDVGEMGPGFTQFVSVMMGPKETGPDEMQPRDGSSTVDAAVLAVPPKAAKEMRRAIDASSEGDSNKAITHLLKALKIHPDFTEAHNNLAVQYVKLGRIDDAVRSFEKSVELRPTSKAFFNLGILYFQTNRRRDAASALNRASELDTSDVAALRALAEVYYKIGQYVLAVKSYRRLAALQPDDAKVHLSLGYCFLRLQMPEDASSEFRRYLQDAPAADGADRVREMLARLEKARP